MTATDEFTAPKPTRIPPIVTPDAKFFWEGADREEFLGQKCGDCNKFVFPPRPMCPFCFSLKREEVKLSGYGTVHAWTIPRHPAPFGFKEPPVVAVIELEEGIRFVSNVIDVEPQDMQMDMPVEVTFAATMKDHKVPVFRPRLPLYVGFSAHTDSLQRVVPAATDRLPSGEKTVGERGSLQRCGWKSPNGCRSLKLA